MENHKFDLVIVSPLELTFYAPYDRSQRRLLTVLNPTPNRLLYKIRSNASRHYNVSPSCGSVEAYGTTEICITLNYFDFDMRRRYRHRFNIECIRAPVPLPTQLLQAFKQVGRADISNRRVAVLLDPNRVALTESELASLQFKASETELPELRPLCPDCMPHLQSAEPLPHKHCAWVRKLLAVLMTAGAMAVAYYQRQHLLYVLQLDLKAEDVEF